MVCLARDGGLYNPLSNVTFFTSEIIEGYQSAVNEAIADKSNECGYQLTATWNVDATRENFQIPVSRLT